MPDATPRLPYVLPGGEDESGAWCEGGLCCGLSDEEPYLAAGRRVLIKPLPDPACAVALPPPMLSPETAGSALRLPRALPGGEEESERWPTPALAGM